MRVLRILVLLVLAVLGVAIVVTQTEWGERKITDAATDAIRDQLGLEATFGAVEVRVHVLPPGLELHATDIQLDHHTHGRFAQARSLGIEPSLWALVTGRVDLDHIELVEPQVHLLIEDGVIVNLPEFPESDGGTTELPFQRLEILGAAVTFDAFPFLTGNLRDLDLTLDVDDDLTRIELACHGGTLNHAGGEEELVQLDVAAQLDLGGERLAVDQATLALSDLRIEVSDGTVPFDLEEPYGGRVSVRVDLAMVQRLPTAFEIPHLSGVILVEGDLNGAGSAWPTGSAHVRAEDVWINQRFGLGDFIDLQLQINEDTVEVLEESHAQLARNGGDIGLSGVIELDEEAGFPTRVRTYIRSFQMVHLLHQLSASSHSVAWFLFQCVGALEGTLIPFRISGPQRLTTPAFSLTVDSFTFHSNT